MHSSPCEVFYRGFGGYVEIECSHRIFLFKSLGYPVEGMPWCIAVITLYWLVHGVVLCWLFIFSSWGTLAEQRGDSEVGIDMGT